MVALSVCPFCTHYQDLQSVGGDLEFTCAAFPQGIPSEFLTGEQVHITPVTGDQGIQFAPKLPLPDDLPDEIRQLMQR